MIIGTAGHIDHGKTALIKALTGVEADRLAEEKKRGLTIDLGFAYQPLADGDVLGFVDVPGHERFVPNMLSGALAVDYVLLVVAADDGPMPQSREHLAIIDLLGLDRGVVALTKCDRVDAARREAATAEVRGLLAGSCLEHADIRAVSAYTGEGVAALHAQLEAVARRQSPRADHGHFRLAIDRAFTLSGAGTVVTGTVHSGRVALDDRLRISPQNLEARVRAVHRQNARAETARAGDRCALNLTGRRLDRHAIRRGDWAVAAPAHAPTERLDARLRVVADHPRTLLHWTPIHVHIGAADIPGRVAVLDDDAITPGASGLAQLVLRRPVPALAGDRFIVRDQSATHTVGGGRVLDAFAPGRGRRKPRRLALLAALEHADPASALAALLAVAGVAGLDLDWFERLRNLDATQIEALGQAVAFETVDQGGRRLAFAVDAWRRLSEAIVTAVDQHHQRDPASAGLAESKLAAPLRTALGARPPRAVIAAAVARLIAARRLARSGRRLCLASHRVALTPEHQRLWALVEPRLRAGGLRPPRVRELAESCHETRETLRRVFRQQAASGALWQVSEELFYPPGVIARIAADTERTARAGDGRLTVKSFREGAGVSRNVAVELLEFFDRTGLTARVADGRRLHGDAAELYGAPDAARSRQSR